MGLPEETEGSSQRPSRFGGKRGSIRGEEGSFWEEENSKKRVSSRREDWRIKSYRRKNIEGIIRKGIEKESV